MNADDTWSSHLFQNEALLPAQVTVSPYRGGCYILLHRIFEQAWEDFIKYHPTRRKSRHGSTLYASADLWFASTDNDCFSFQWICDHFGWDADIVRKELYNAILGEKKPYKVRHRRV